MKRSGLRGCVEEEWFRNVWLVMLVFLCVGATDTGAQSVIYVDVDAKGSSDGSTWDSAYEHLQDALAVVSSGDEIWVAAGTYLPDHGSGYTIGDSSARFLIPDGVGVYGGFLGDENSHEQRDWLLYETVLSGDLLQNDAGEVSGDEPSRSDNSIGVVRIVDGPEYQVLDGFIVSGSQALNSATSAIKASGNVELRNLRVERNYAPKQGPGVSISETSNGCPRLTAVVFDANAVELYRGGALYSSCSSVQVHRDLVFSNNVASQGAGLLFIGTVVLLNPIFVNNQSNDGGAIYATELSNLTVINGFIVGNHSFYGGAVTAEDKATVSLINTVVAHNTALGDGGGIYNLGSRIRLFNSVLAYNSSGADGGGLWEHTDHAKSGTEIVNSIIWGNTASGEGSQLFQLDVEPVKLVGMKRSLFQGPLPSYVDDDLLTIYSAPLFVDIDGIDGVAGTLDDDFRLSALSPAIDAGDNSLIPVDTLDLDVDLDTTDQIPFDLLNHQRIFDGGTGGQTVDLGPYEFGAPTLGAGRPGIRFRRTAYVFPNPAHDEIIVQLDRPLVSAASVQVFDVLGRRTLIVHSNAGAAQIRIQTKYFASGSYVLFIGRGAEQLVAPVHFVILH